MNRTTATEAIANVREFQKRRRPLEDALEMIYSVIRDDSKDGKGATKVYINQLNISDAELQQLIKQLMNDGYIINSNYDNIVISWLPNDLA